MEGFVYQNHVILYYGLIIIMWVFLLLHRVTSVLLLLTALWVRLRYLICSGILIFQKGSDRAMLGMGKPKLVFKDGENSSGEGTVYEQMLGSVFSLVAK